MKIVAITGVSPPTVYLAVPGVLHPSESDYELAHGRSPWGDGHSRFESLSVLVSALQSWPEAKIVFTSTPSQSQGLPAVLKQQDPALAGRVVGHTYDDLTTKVRRQAQTCTGTTRTVGYSSNDYWRMSKAEIVTAHVAWSRPAQWVVVDAEDLLWPGDVRRDRLVLTDSCVGLRGEREQNRLHTVLLLNFGTSEVRR